MSPDSIPTLKWESIDIKKELEVIVSIIEDEVQKTPRRNTRTLGKLRRWKTECKQIQVGLQKIKKHIKPHLQGLFGLDLDRNGLLTAAMFQPSTRNLFLEMRIHYVVSKERLLDLHTVDELASLSDFAKVLALLGDAAIDMAILHHLWQPRAVDVGQLTQERARIVSNEHLAEKCDEWKLYENRIHFDPATPSKSEIEHIKGTLVEAIFGVMYLEAGYREALESVVYLLD